MQVAINYSEALRNNIERTYTYSHARNVHGVDVEPERYDSISFFNELVKKDPFGAFMELDGYAFKNSLNALIRYDIPYTKEQERRAKVYHEVVEDMKRNRADVSYGYQEDVSNTGVVKYADPHIYTTKHTMEARKFIGQLPRNKKTFNILHVEKVPTGLMNSIEQFKALENSIENHVSCLIGGAGTGKSYVTSAIVEQLILNDKEVAILAPTHKAKEALQTKLERGLVQTIHSFVYNPKAVDAIVIDEAGMLSAELMAKLGNIYNGEQLVFVGDKNQIPPVDYGRPFELIQELFPTVSLKANRRSEAEDIIALGREIIGEPFNANIGQHNITQVNTIEEAFEQGAEVLLTFTNANVKRANEQQRIKNGEPAIHRDFSIGDKIMAKTNTDRFFNGQLFTIATWGTATDGKGNTINFRTPYELSNNFDLAYGLTIHKSQGSEWDIVAYQPTEMDTKNLAYVAVTRAKKKLIIVGGFPDQFKEERDWTHL